MRDFEYIDALYRSRITMLDILESQGFEVSKYRGFSPKEVEAMNIDMEQIGTIDVNHKKDKNKKARIIYLSSTFNRKKTVSIDERLQAGYKDEDNMADLMSRMEKMTIEKDKKEIKKIPRKTAEGKLKELENKDLKDKNKLL